MTSWRKDYAGCSYVGCNPVEIGRAAQHEIKRLRMALEMIAGRRQCIDNLMSNQEIAIAALDEDEDRTPDHMREGM